MPGMSHGTRPLAELIFLGGQELFRQVPPFSSAASYSLIVLEFSDMCFTLSRMSDCCCELPCGIPVLDLRHSNPEVGPVI